MDTGSVNWLAVLVAGVINLVVGAVWFSPSLFGKTWMKELGMKESDRMGGSEMGKTYGITFVGALVMAFVTALVVRAAGADTVAEGLVVGLWVWLGYAVTIPLNDVLFGKKSWNLYFLNVMYYLVVLAITGALLATWM
jgi:hypothetical protein